MQQLPLGLSELPRFLTHIFPLAILVVFPIAWVAPDTFAYLVEYEDDLFEQTGSSLAVIENLTVLFLLPGIIAGAAIWYYYRSAFPQAWVGHWVLLWTLAMFFFAGEEMSWGQWYFHWDTPDWFMERNRQGETNFHNMSSWLAHRPRTLVMVLIFITGFFIPLKRRIKGAAPYPLDSWKCWVLPTQALMISAAVFMVFRISDWLPWESMNKFGTGELREYCVAVFLSLYMLSLHARIKSYVAQGKLTGAG